jgi:hypothetical protein
VEKQEIAQEGIVGPGRWKMGEKGEIIEREKPRAGWKFRS